MSRQVYNSAIRDVSSNPVPRAFGPSAYTRHLRWLIASVLCISACFASDWNTPEQELARKIFAITGPARVRVTFDNRSSLSKRESDIVENGIRSAMQAAGLRFVVTDQAVADVLISLSENPLSYVWIAQIHPTAGDPALVMVSTTRSEMSRVGEEFPLNIRAIPLFTQEQPILDVAILEENSTPTRMVVLGPEKLSWYRLQSGRWQPEQTLAISHTKSWPRDLRGRLILTPDHALDVFLPGVVCRAEVHSETLSCRESDDPWPLLPAGWNAAGAASKADAVINGASAVLPQIRAFFAPTRNFFTGVLTPGVGGFTTVAKFFSLALLPRNNNALWLFADVDGQVHVTDGTSEQVGNFRWGSDLASLKTPCGAGWQVLASSAEEQASDSIRAYEFPDRDPVAVSPKLEFDGAITALWTEVRGDTAVAVSKNGETGTYEAFRLAMACGQ